MEVGPDHVTILADSAERADEIDEERAEAARHRAEDTHGSGERSKMQTLLRAEAALRRSLLRLKVAKRKRRRGRSGAGSGPVTRTGARKERQWGRENLPSPNRVEYGVKLSER